MTDRGQRRDRALDLLKRALARRACTQAELDSRLRRDGFDAEEIRWALERARELRLFEEDDALALRLAESLARRERETPTTVSARLVRRGLSEDAIARAVAAAFAGWDPRQRAKAFLETEKDMRRGAARLARRGFPRDAVAWALRSLGHDAELEP